MQDRSERADSRERAPRHLITTAREDTWVHDRPVLFLGEWCRRYRRRELWSAMDALVAAPYGLSPRDKARDYAFVGDLTLRFLEPLGRVLNRQHGVHHDQRHWRIVLGHWLFRCVSVLFNRFATLEQTLSRCAVSSSTVLPAPAYSLATFDSLSFIWASNDDTWNHVLYARMLASFGVRLEAAEVSLADTGFRAPRASANAPVSTRQKLQRSLNQVLRSLVRDTDAFIINSYLPRNVAAKLQLSLGQAPQAWTAVPPPEAPADLERRRGLQLDVHTASRFESLAAQLLPDMLPTCYLEGYPQLLATVARQKWPVRPKFIFTSNNFDTDEVFKTWAAEKVEQGTAYITGQHGLNYGTLKHCATAAECTAISDRFVTWGWTESKRHEPAFLFQTAARRPRPMKRDGDLLLVQLRLRHRLEPWDTDAEFHTYQQEQFRFVAALPQSVRDCLRVRLHAGHKRNVWADDERWRDNDPSVRIDGGSTPMRSLLASSRLIVHSYNSTGIIEQLALDIPTVFFWNSDIEVLLESAVPYYEQLMRVGIFFTNPEAAARQVAAVWDDVPAWWQSPTVRAARESFCARYGRSVSSPVGTLKRLLLDNVRTRS